MTADERETLARWTRWPTTARALAERARVVLECAAGKPNTVVARELRLTKQTIGKGGPLAGAAPRQTPARTPAPHPRTQGR
jgi:hypothetical protein